MKNSIRKYSKIIMFKKINDVIHQDKKLFQSYYFDFFLYLNDCNGVLTPENIDNFTNAYNIEELKELYRNIGCTVYDEHEWNAYDALEKFFTLPLSIPENSAFEDLWIRTNSKRIIEDIFRKIKNDDISKDELLVLLERIIKKELNQYSYLSKKVSTYIMKSKEYLKDKIKYIFELNYLINYTEQKQLQILDYTIHHVYKLFENDKKLNLILVKELECFFSVNSLQKKILEKANELLDENNYYNQMYMLKHFINIFHYDIVVNDKYLEILVDFYFEFISSTATIIILKELKSNKKQRVIEQINKYLKDEGTNYKPYFIGLKKRLNFYEKNTTSSIIELFYKELVDEELEIEKVINRLHHNLNLNKNTFLNSKEEISNEMVFDKKVISFQKILLNNS